MFLEVNHLEKTFQTRFSKEKTQALRDVNFIAEEGEFIISSYFVNIACLCSYFCLTHALCDNDY